MTNEPVETVRYDSGLRAEIFHDPDAEQPFLRDDAVRLVVLHRRYIDPARGACGRDPGEVAQWEADNRREWFTIPLFLYDHGGTVYRTGRSNPFPCPWDSGRVGILALRRDQWGNGQPSDEELEAFAAAIAEEYSCWADGECYGFVLHDPSDAEIDACWGFLGREAAIAAAAEATRSFAACSTTPHGRHAT